MPEERPPALKWTKYIVHAASQMSEEDAMRYSDAAYRFLEKTADGIEGPAAFVEKRAPQWQGSLARRAPRQDSAHPPRFPDFLPLSRTGSGFLKPREPNLSPCGSRGFYFS